MSEQQVLSQLETVKNNQSVLEAHLLNIIGKLQHIESDMTTVKGQLTQGYSGNVHHKLDIIVSTIRKTARTSRGN